MAEVYAAVTAGEGSFRRPVVIKRLRPELTANPNAVAQFCDEANLLAAFHHPNIVAVHDFGRWENQFFLAEEYVQGRDLGRIVSKGLSPPAAARRAPRWSPTSHVKILKGLDYAHTMENERGRPMGIVHRDVSPENIVVSPRGEVKLLDFGVVKATEGRAGKDGDGGGQRATSLTCPPSRPGASTSTPAPTSSRSRWSCTSAAPATRSTPLPPPMAS